jgi:tRNA threonylcarbamoyladenosine biosynthesis protein TsaB
MVLYIDTTIGDNVLISLRDGKKTLAKKSFLAPRQQSEKLLPAIEQIIKSHGFDLKQIKKIEVANQGGGFSALRIGVVTANALAYALGVPIEGSDKKPKNAGKIQVVAPQYDREPSITVKKANHLHHI